MSLKALQMRRPFTITNSIKNSSNQIHSYNNNNGLSKYNILLQRIDKRGFAGNETVHYPKKFKNVFNKWTSRDGKRVYYTTFPFDYNEPWPFPPVYDKETGQDLNKDPVWGEWGEAPNSSITGKPRRALGHYPWLGRPIVPLDETKRYIMDDQMAPYPFFVWGRYEQHRGAITQWTVFFIVFFAAYYFIDHVWRGDGAWGNLAKQRDELFYKEMMAPSQLAYAPIGTAHYANPTAPWRRTFDNTEPWKQKNDWFESRFSLVWVPASKEDHFADESPNYFKLPGYNC